MGKKVSNISQTATSKMLSKYGSQLTSVNKSANERIAAILKKQFATYNRLVERRKLVNEKIRENNVKYVKVTQDVLNDKTLDFLVQHSNIDAPTFTSIIAGFELARKSAADKGKELLIAENAALANDQKIEDQRFEYQKTMDDKAIAMAESQRGRDNKYADQQFSSMGGAFNNDLTYARRQQAMRDKAQLDMEKEAYKARADAQKAQFEEAARLRREQNPYTGANITASNVSGLGRQQQPPVANQPQPPVSSQQPPAVTAPQQPPTQQPQVLDGRITDDTPPGLDDYLANNPQPSVVQQGPNLGTAVDGIVSKMRKAGVIKSDEELNNFNFTEKDDSGVIIVTRKDDPSYTREFGYDGIETRYKDAILEFNMRNKEANPSFDPNEYDYMTTDDGYLTLTSRRSGLVTQPYDMTQYGYKPPEDSEQPTQLIDDADQMLEQNDPFSSVTPESQEIVADAIPTDVNISNDDNTLVSTKAKLMTDYNLSEQDVANMTVAEMERLVNGEEDDLDTRESDRTV